MKPKVPNLIQKRHTRRGLTFPLVDPPMPRLLVINPEALQLRAVHLMVAQPKVVQPMEVHLLGKVFQPTLPGNLLTPHLQLQQH